MPFPSPPGTHSFFLSTPHPPPPTQKRPARSLHHFVTLELALVELLNVTFSNALVIHVV